jgi:alpha-ketoglutarate-dependent taurine dioxygenase
VQHYAVNDYWPQTRTLVRATIDAGVATGVATGVLERS